MRVAGSAVCLLLFQLIVVHRGEQKETVILPAACLALRRRLLSACPAVFRLVTACRV